VLIAVRFEHWWLVGLPYDRPGAVIVRRLMRSPNRTFLSAQPLKFGVYKRVKFSNVSLYCALL